MNMEWGRSEIGSMLHWETEFPAPVWSWPEPAAFFSLCRHALEALCGARRTRPTLWLPSFFCFEVARHCQAVADIREYHDDCRWSEPDWSTLRPRPEDLVLAVNYFGVRSPEPWNRWRQNNSCILVEDHTQDPFSEWARNSTSNYAVCSIRKTVPVPDGAILWSPTGNALPEAPQAMDWNGSSLKAGAMLYKRSYLSETSDPDLKARYRDLQLRGEEMLSRSACSAISPVAEAIVSFGVPKFWRERRAANTRLLITLLNDFSDAQPAFRTWPERHAPFVLPLVFPSTAARDHYQDAMRKENIYCPVEWVCDTTDPGAKDLSSRILSISTDHRYSETDMRRIAEVMQRVGCESHVEIN